MRLLAPPKFGGRLSFLAVIGVLFVIAIIYPRPFVNVGRHVRGQAQQHLGSLWSSSKPNRPNLPVRQNHPIDFLIRNANTEFEVLLAKSTDDVHDAAAAYRLRRGRQPPPGFDLWHAYAVKHNALIVEDFWDQIYHDLEPFWGVEAKLMRDSSNSFSSRISVRDGKVRTRSSGQQPAWPAQWTDMIKDFARFLPDVDLALNEMDEPRMVVDWHEIEVFMRKANGKRRVVPEDQLEVEYAGLAALDAEAPKFDHAFGARGPYWSKAVMGCPPDSPARKESLVTDFTGPPSLTGQHPPHTYEGYVQNWTLAKSTCDIPHLQSLHGTFIEMTTMKHTARLWPLFSGSKLSVGNEILLPGAMYWSDNPRYSTGSSHGANWESKKEGAIWRGAASGGRNRRDNWTHFQRHRFVSMNNATEVLAAETNDTTMQQPLTFILPAGNAYQLSARSPHSSAGSLATWIASWANIAFVHLICFPRQPKPYRHYCPYTDPYYRLADPIPMSEFYDHKYLPDIDGNSFSGRYRGYLASTSLPIKATVYNEWHDSRLVAWKHFVPMDNTFVDFYGIMEYFLGNREAGLGDRDRVARELALAGKVWSEKVLRRADMRVYVFRLLLEYARLCDDRREILGWKEGS